MNEETKQAIQVALTILKTTLINNNASCGFDKDNNKLFFFDTATYVNKKSFSGFSVSLDDLVKENNDV